MFQLEGSLAEGVPSYRMVNLFVLFSPSTDQIRPIHIRKCSLLYSDYNSNINIIRNTTPDTHRVIFDQMPCDPSS